MDDFEHATVLEAIEAYVLPAMVESITKHGRLTGDHVRAMAILTEEAGESASEILSLTRPSSAKEFRRAKAIEELAQTASVAILMIINLDMERETRT